MIRLPEIPDLQQTAIRMPAMSGKSPQATALGNLAQSIGNVGEAFAKHADTIDKQDQLYKSSDWRNKLRENYANFQLENAKEPDPVKRLKSEKDWLVTYKGSLEDQGFNDETKIRESLHYDDFATSARIGSAQDAARQNTQRAALAWSNEYEALKEAGNREGYADLRKRGIDGGILLPEQLDKMDKDFEKAVNNYDRAIKFQDLQRQIDQNPHGLLNSLEKPDAPQAYGLDTEAIDSLRRQAAHKKNQHDGEFWDGVLNQTLTSGSPTISKEDLQKLAEDGSISPNQRASYLNAYYGPTEPSYDEGIFSKVHEAIASYDPAKDPTQSALAKMRGDLATVPLPKESLRVLNDQLSGKLKSPDSPKNRLESDFSRQTANHFDSGRFGSWFALKDTDNNSSTAPTKVINAVDYGKALITRRHFLDAWDSYLKAAPADLPPEEAQKTYDTLFQKIVVDKAPLPDLSVPGSAPAPDFEKELDKLFPQKSKPTDKSTSSTFGGQPIQPAGRYYENARPTVFGGTNDPADNGLSAFGGTTGAGGREGVAIPQSILAATFPGKDKKWIADNVKVHVKTDAGTDAVLNVADYGTAESIWQRDKRPVLDLTEGAIAQLGGRATYNSHGKLSGVEGFKNVNFALTTGKAGTLPPDSPWEDLWRDWFADKRPTHPDQIQSGLAALWESHLMAKAGE
jgi:hypothetical protein